MNTRNEMIQLADEGWNVVAITKRETKSGRWTPTLWMPGKNIVTNDGDLYYAQMASSTAPTNDFDHATTAGLILGTGLTAVGKTDTVTETIIVSGDTALESGYDKVNDGDADNTGAGTDIITWKYAYATGDFNDANISEGSIDVNHTTPGGAVLCHFLFAAAFAKSATNTLTVYVNHTFTGV